MLFVLLGVRITRFDLFVFGDSAHGGRRGLLFFMVCGVGLDGGGSESSGRRLSKRTFVELHFGNVGKVRALIRRKGSLLLHHEHGLLLPTRDHHHHPHPIIDVVVDSFYTLLPISQES
jgi:hypothetical protein